MSDVISDFIKRAQLLPVAVAVSKLGLELPKKDDQGAPCPRCGGKDRFAVSLAKEAWNCRGCGTGGRGAIGLIAHVQHLDLHSRADLLEAASIALGEEIPDGGERETPEQKADRERRMRAVLEQAERDSAEKRAQQEGFREREVRKARGIFLNATTAPHPDDAPLRDYLRLRTGFQMAEAVFENIRFDRRHTYWHGQDERGNPLSHYVGFAMIAPFVNLEGHITGCHETWIDLNAGPKFRPDLGRDDKGMALPTKKMRGTKKGSIIPVCGNLSTTRWLGGEGIETVAAVAGYEGFRADTFYFATGDLGNLAGPADRASDVRHPSLTTKDARGRVRAVKVPGPVPKPDQTAGDAFQVPAHVEALVLLADGDSEFIFTAAAMARAKARLSPTVSNIGIWWPPHGSDFAQMLSARQA